MDFNGKVAVITGGATGLGRAIAQEIAGRGARIAIVYSRSKAEAVGTVAELTKRDTDAAAFQADVSVEEDVRRAVEQTIEAFGHIDLLFNNAAMTKFVPFKDLDGLSGDEWDRIMAVNVKGPWLMSRVAAPALRERKGAIVNVASIAGLSPGGSSLCYCVSKSALIHLTTCLAMALAPDVRVNCLAPGLFLTRWTAGFTPDQIAAMENRTPLMRVVAIEDLARMAVELAGNESMTGETVVVDGGLRYA